MSKDKQKEESLFRLVVGEVKPLKSDAKKLTSKKVTKPSPKLSPRSELREQPFLPLSDYYTEVLHAETTIDYTASDVSLCPSLIKKIQQGEYPKDVVIDLHGETVESAREKLSAILQEAHQNQQRGLFIIHGKGKHAMLKNHVIHWLKQVPWVMYFCSATVHEGGAGALYVLLKRKKMHDLAELRSKIDEVDTKINALLCKRFGYAKKVAALKKTTQPDVKREQEILMRMRQYAVRADISPERMEAIYLTILREMKKYQQNVE